MELKNEWNTQNERGRNGGGEWVDNRTVYISNGLNSSSVSIVQCSWAWLSVQIACFRSVIAPKQKLSLAIYVRANCVLTLISTGNNNTQESAKRTHLSVSLENERPRDSFRSLEFSSIFRYFFTWFCQLDTNTVASLQFGWKVINKEACKWIGTDGQVSNTHSHIRTNGNTYVE